MLNDYQYVFVLTYGRSGSTILMKILNSINGFDIRGENHNTLFHLQQSIDAVARTKAQRGASATDPGTPWYGAPEIDAAAFRNAGLNAFVRDVLRPKPGARVLGFKEIRNTDAMMNGEDFAGYVSFVLANFPNAKIIFNTRNAEKVAESGWFANMPTPLVLERIATSDRWFSDACDRHDACFQIDYDDVVANGARLAAMFDFLGVAHDADSVAGMLNVPLTHLKSGRAGISPLKKLLHGFRRK